MWYVCVYKCVHTHTPKMECYAAKKKKKLSSECMLVTSVSGRENKSTDGSGNQASEINRNLEVTRNRN